MENGVEKVENAPAEEKPPEPLRFEVVLERTVIVYAADIESASARALQVDGVANRYKVVEVNEVPSSGMDSRAPLIDKPPPRPTWLK